MGSASNSHYRSGTKEEGAEYWDTCHSIHEEEEGGSVHPGLESVSVADRTFLSLASAYPHGLVPQSCHFARVTQTVSLIITRRRRSLKQVYDTHGLLRCVTFRVHVNNILWHCLIN